MLQDDSKPDSATVFLQSWELEIWAGYTPADELDIQERLDEYLYSDVSPGVEARLIAEVTRATDRLLSAARELEETWSEPTMNDRIAAAFHDLSAEGILARECAGLSIQDGWGLVGLEPQGRYRGAAFFHKEDVFDALHGESLLLAFGGVGARSTDPADAQSIAVSTLEALAARGVPARWSGDVDDRIEILPFEWQRRRWTAAPMAGSSSVPWQRTGKQLTLFTVSDAELKRFKVPVRAYRTCYAFDRLLSAGMRGVWKSLGGERGQAGHSGDPHVFVPAGETTEMMPRDAFANLDPREAAALRARAMAAISQADESTGPACETIADNDPARPWWRLW